MLINLELQKLRQKEEAAINLDEQILQQEEEQKSKDEQELEIHSKELEAEEEFIRMEEETEEGIEMICRIRKRNAMEMCDPAHKRLGYMDD